MKAKIVPQRRTIVILAGLAVLALAAYAGSQRPLAQLAVGYGAHVACSCHYVGGRSLDACRADFEPGMGLVGLSHDSAARRVTASIPLLASRSAVYRPGLGCTLE